MKHRADDSLSRLPTNGANTTSLEEDFPLIAIETPDCTNTVIHFAAAISGAIPLDAKNIPLNTWHSAADLRPLRKVMNLYANKQPMYTVKRRRHK